MTAERTGEAFEVDRHVTAIGRKLAAGGQRGGDRPAPAATG